MTSAVVLSHLMFQVFPSHSSPVLFSWSRSLTSGDVIGLLLLSAHQDISEQHANTRGFNKQAKRKIIKLHLLGTTFYLLP